MSMRNIFRTSARVLAALFVAGLAGITLASFTGCGGEIRTTTQPPPEEKKEIAKEEPKAEAELGEKEVDSLLEQKKVKAKIWKYRSNQRRDPFVPLLTKPKKKKQNNSREGSEKTYRKPITHIIKVETLKLRGIMQFRNDNGKIRLMAALYHGADGNEWLLGAGDQILDIQVLAVTPSSITIRYRDKKINRLKTKVLDLEAAED